MLLAWKAVSRIGGTPSLSNGYRFASLQRINNTQNGTAVYMQPTYFIPASQGIRSLASFRLNGSRLSMLADFRGNVSGATDDPFQGNLTSKGDVDSLLWIYNSTKTPTSFRPSYTRAFGGSEATMAVTGADFFSSASSDMAIGGSWKRYWWVLLQNAPDAYFALSSNNASAWRPFIMRLNTEQMSASVTAGAPIFGEPPVPNNAQQPLAPPVIPPPESPPVDPPADAPVSPPENPPVTPPMDPPPEEPPADPPVDPPTDIIPPPVVPNPPAKAPVAAPVRAPVRPPVLPPQRPPVAAPVRAPQRPPALAPQRPPVAAPLAPPLEAPAPPPLASPTGAPVRIIIRPPVDYSPFSPSLPPADPNAPIFDPNGPPQIPPPPPPPPPRNAPPRIPPTPASLGATPREEPPEAAPTSSAYLNFLGRDWTQTEFYLLVGCSGGGLLLILVIICCCCKKKKKKSKDHVEPGQAYEVNADEIQHMPETPVATITPAKLEKRFSKRFAGKQNRVHSQPPEKDWWDNSPSGSPISAVEMAHVGGRNHDPSPEPSLVQPSQLEDSSAEERRRRRRAQNRRDEL
jgi:hypothetical protein